jgi:hypothetical protein
MQRCSWSAAIALGAVLVCSSAVGGDDSAAASEGFSMPLFNGQDLAGWHVTDCEAAVEQGAIVLKSGNGLVRTDHRYGDFLLELDWRARKNEAWDSGIYFRAELPTDREKRPWPARYQANLAQGKEGNVGGLAGAESSGLVKPGEWNHFKLTVVGSRAALEINGRPAWETEGIEAADGYIGLQAEVPQGGEFEFKNITITELDHQSLFNGQDLTGWEGAGTDAGACWRVEDGLLVCTGEEGPWLRSAEEYGDFNLRLEYRLKPGGNSGVYCRVPENGAHRGREIDGEGPCGVEIQLLDDASDRYKDLQDYQFSGSVYAIAPAREHVSRPPGEWNTLEIECRGTSYRITHNGIAIVDAKESEFPELANRQTKGFLGLQNHSEQVWFRNVRLGPLADLSDGLD